MCGIAGAYCFGGEEPSRRALQEMVAQLRHRGPDASGIAIDGSVGLGHARLSIIDLDLGRQPMHNRDRSLTLTFNGEIFNYVELRETLQCRGHRFQTRSDTEVILHAYEEYGEQCVDHFNGQWAFAIWDKRRRRLFLSRDRFGIRPLFYTHTGSKFLFASEVKSLFVHSDVSRSIDPQGLNQLFTFWSTLAPKTVFRGICELPPGHNMRVEGDQIHTWPYWKLEYAPEDEKRSVDDWAEQLLELLTDATRLRLRSDVPVGAYLSGGLDSSVTTALVKRCTNNHLRTFSVTFGDAEFDESEYQNQVVRFLETDHQAVLCAGDTIARVFPEVIRHTETPVLRTAPAPLFILSKLVRDERFKVVLTGEGADEMLGGYDIFKEAKVRRFCAAQPDSAFRALLFQKLYPDMPNLQAQSLAYRKAFFRVRPEDLSSPFFSHLPRWELTSRLKRFFSHEVRAELEGHDVYADVREMLPDGYCDWSPLCQAQYLETAVLMPGYILSSQGDRMALAHGVEGRFPFLDHRVAELAARMPPRLKMKALNEKYILKRAARDLVPPEVLGRTKQPYRAPDAASFFDPHSQSAREDYVVELLSPGRIRDGGIFHPEAVDNLAEKARQGKVIGIKDNMALVGILSTQLLIEQFVDKRQRAGPPLATAIEAEGGPHAATPCKSAT